MNVDDLPAVFDVRASTVENAISIEQLESKHGITPASLTLEMQDKAAGWLCEADDQVVGFCMGGRSNGEITVLAVRPEAEGHGIGARLLEATGQWLFDEGHEQIWLTSNPDPGVRAHGFYRSQGWQPDRRVIRKDEVLVLDKAGNPG